MLSRADQIPLLPLIILSSFTVLRSVQLPKEPAHWFRQHPAISFSKEFAVLVLERPTSMAPKSHRSFHELVGSLECFPGQYRRGVEIAWFFKRHTPDCLSWVLSSSAPVRPSKCLRGFWGSRCQLLPETGPPSARPGFFSDPPRALFLPGPTPFSFEKSEHSWGSRFGVSKPRYKSVPLSRGPSSHVISECESGLWVRETFRKPITSKVWSLRRNRPVLPI